MAQSQSKTFNPALPITTGSATETSEALRAALAEIARLKSEAASKVKVLILDPTDKRPDPLVAVVGIRRFPVSFYVSEWDKLFAVIDTVKAACQSLRSRK